jgi:hypothetical protein
LFDVPVAPEIALQGNVLGQSFRVRDESFFGDTLVSSLWKAHLVTNDSNVIRCPSCGGRDVRPSLSRGVLDAIIGAFGRTPMRCRQCQRRFHKRVERKEGEADHTVLRESDED